MSDPWAAFRVQQAPADPWAEFRAPEAPEAPSGQRVWQNPHRTELRNPAPVRGGVARAPGLGATAAASLATDAEQRRRIYARQMFPDLPLNEALGRIDIGEGGRLFAVQPDGSTIPIEPQTPNMERPGSFAPGNVARWAASGAGAALPIAGGVAGGVAGGPTSLVTGPLAAAAGAAAGDAARQGLAGYFDPGSQPYNLLQTATEAGMAGAGQAAGALVNRALAPNALRIPEREIGQVARNPAVTAGARTAQANAQAQGVELSAGQASGLPSLLTLEDAALQNPATIDRARQFYQRQGGQMQQAARSMFDSVSPVDDITQASQAFREAAGEVPGVVRRQGNAAAAPAYDAARQAGQVVSPDLAALMDNPAVQQAMQQARQTYRIRYGREAPAQPDFSLWDLTKRALDDLHGTTQREGNRTLASAYDDVRTRLRDRLDDAFPTYPQARAATAPTQRLAATLEETAAGTAGAAGVDDRARAILAPVFQNSNPQYVAQVREAFVRAGRLDDWNAGIRGFLQDAIARASTSQAGLNPTMLRRQIWANVEDGVRVNMQAAMTPEQFAGFNRFMQTVEQVARTFPPNSATVLRGGGQEALREAGETGATRLTRAVGNTLSPEVLGVVRRGLNRVADWQNARNVAAVVDNLFSPEGVTFLEQMARISPSSRQAIVLTGQFLGRGAAAGEQPTPPPQ